MARRQQKRVISKDIMGRRLKDNNSSRKMLVNGVLGTAGVLGCVGRACGGLWGPFGAPNSQMKSFGKSAQIINFLRLTDAIPGDQTS